MGCNASTEVQVLQVKKPLEIPPIPGWDGDASRIMPVQVELQLDHSMNGSVATSIDAIMNSIVAENTAGDGFRPISIFLPFYPEGNPMDPKSYPETLEKYAGGEFFSNTMNSKAMCIFQKSKCKSEPSQETFETLNLSVKITLEGHGSMTNPWKKVEGHEEIINKLDEAGV